eukprot:gnl/TRDRNA2_/TRDRNA2_175166_c14_seq1.p1 gnl/TRDRNA2_/TRDRNA2_175166_c14~~gnl/TRDRNA2_/TRDRNA2_175166_c14_seq1.p1  ORF type:complete len:528 (+),score=93.15 gnl/TRDRNA2_/TRDRNA2_175166_c14_seq1:200-1585(+)
MAENQEAIAAKHRAHMGELHNTHLERHKANMEYEQTVHVKRVGGATSATVHALVFELTDGTRFGRVLWSSGREIAITDDVALSDRGVLWYLLEFDERVVKATGHESKSGSGLCGDILLRTTKGREIIFRGRDRTNYGAEFSFRIPRYMEVFECYFAEGTCTGIRDELPEKGPTPIWASRSSPNSTIRSMSEAEDTLKPGHGPEWEEHMQQHILNKNLEKEANRREFYWSKCVGDHDHDDRMAEHRRKIKHHFARLFLRDRIRWTKSYNKEMGKFGGHQAGIMEKSRMIDTRNQDRLSLRAQYMGFMAELKALRMFHRNDVNERQRRKEDFRKQAVIEEMGEMIKMQSVDSTQGTMKQGSFQSSAALQLLPSGTLKPLTGKKGSRPMPEILHPYLADRRHTHQPRFEWPRVDGDWMPPDHSPASATYRANSALELAKSTGKFPKSASSPSLGSSSFQGLSSF